MARMLGRVSPGWCPFCATPPVYDCLCKGRTPREQRREEQRQLRREAAEAIADRATSRGDTW